MIVIGFLRNITLVCRERYITDSGVGDLKPKSVVITLVENHEENDRVSLEFPKDFSA
jgi:hypothetical protein